MGEVDREKGEKFAVTAATTTTEVAEEEDGSSSEVVRWEKLLPRMVLRVLLVEADDSTRHIISALLRKCSYRVAAVPDGLMAWEKLKGRPHNIDLILTEVDLPLISGYALLTLVMDHDICKNIPVIMMSSSDSINMVLKCMLKGAADFLIKPVRRNELRNLWQHVWRRHTLNAGRISQSSPTTLQKMEATSENNAVSNQSSDCATFSRKNKESDKKQSNAQDLLEPKHRSASIVSNILTEPYEELEKLDDTSVKIETETGERLDDLNEEHEDPSCKVFRYPTSLTAGKECPSTETLRQHGKMRPENDGRPAELLHNHSGELIESSRGAIDLIGTLDNGPKSPYRLLNSKDDMRKFEFTPKLDLCLNNSKDQGVDERHQLNHSNGSAFSWYSNSKLQTLSSMSSSSYIEDGCKSAEQCLHHFSQNMGHKEHSVSLSARNENMTTLVIGQPGESGLTYPTPQIQLFPVPGVRLDTGYGHAVPPVFYTHSGLSPSWSSKLVSLGEQYPFPTRASVHSNHELCDPEQNNRQSDEITINSVYQHVPPERFTKLEHELRHKSRADGHSMSSSLCNSLANYNSSSVLGSSLDRNDGSSSAVAAEKTTAPDALKDGGPLVNDELMGMNWHRSSQREAALTKFRMKRKERCYGKKVRYQSRKRLAEQRPRVKGQFVRQVQSDTLPLDYALS